MFQCRIDQPDDDELHSSPVITSEANHLKYSGVRLTVIDIYYRVRPELN